MAKVDSETPLVVTCKSGNRSAKACAILELLGHKNLLNGVNAAFVMEAVA